jgi:ABC-2 type transport system permease protein
MIRALLRAQLLSMRIGRSRGVVFGIITGVMWYGLWTFIASMAALGASHASAAALERFAPLALLGIFLYWQLVPVLSASMGAALDMRKLLVYPVPHGKLFFVEVLLRLTTGLEMVMVLTGGFLGLLANRSAGGLVAPIRMPLPFLLFILFNLLVASGLRSILERLLSRRHVREVLAVVLMLLWMAPRFLVETGVHPKGLGSVDAVLRTVALPWSAAAHAVLGESTALALAGLACWTLVAAWFGRSQFERNLRYDSVAAQATSQAPESPRRRSLIEGFYRFPSLLWRDPIAAIVEKELRSLARSPRFRMVFVMGFSFGLMLWLPLIIGRNSSRHSTMSEYFLPIVCVYSLTLLGQVTYWNCFGFDRSAAGIYFVAPQPMLKTIVAKNIAHLIYVYIEVVVLIGITSVLPFHIGRGRVIETLLVIGICSIYMLAMGNVSSLRYPRALNPERVAQGGASSRFQALVFILYPLALAPVFLAYLARYSLASDVAFYLVLALAAAIAAVVYWIALESAVSAAKTRREAILQELSKGEGPVVAD